MTRTTLGLALGALLVLGGRHATASDCRLVWNAEVRGDTLLPMLNRFPESGLTFPAEWLPIEPGAHCSLAILDRNGTDILRQDLAEANPPITFAGEFLVVGALTERERPFLGENRGSIQVYACE